MNHYVVDSSGFPLVRITYEGKIDDDAFRAHLAEYAALIARKQRYALVFDATRSGAPGAAQRRMQADFIEEHRAQLSVLCAGGAFAISSPVIRGALTAILWVTSLPFPHTVVADVKSAEAWARTRLDVGDVALSRRETH